MTGLAHPASSNRPARRTPIRRRPAHGALLLGHALVDEARHALRLVLRVVPSAGPSQAGAGAMGAGAEPGRCCGLFRHLVATASLHVA